MLAWALAAMIDGMTEDKGLPLQFSFASAGRILFGAGGQAALGELARPLGKRPFLVTGAHPSRYRFAAEALEEAGLDPLRWAVQGEPTVEMISEAVRAARAAACDMVVAVGGGSALDSGKAVAALLANGGEPLDYLEVIGAGKPLRRPALPTIAIPTTAGTGSEVTKNAVLRSLEHGVKASLRSEFMLPRVALVDPELTYSLPPQLTARTGMDAFTQVLEPLVSRRANPMVDALCWEALPRARWALPAAYADGRNAQARQEMCVVSLFGGLALANAGLGAAHGFAGPLGGMLGAPHGDLCAALIPHVMRANIRAMQARQPEHPALVRYARIARLLTGDEKAGPLEGADWVADLVRWLKIPSLGQMGLGREMIPQVVRRARRSSSMRGNPLELSEAEMMQILESTLEGV